jgi:tetratricopeptide (TPR) repeat protein
MSELDPHRQLSPTDSSSRRSGRALVRIVALFAGIAAIVAVTLAMMDVEHTNARLRDSNRTLEKQVADLQQALPLARSAVDRMLAALPPEPVKSAAEKSRRREGLELAEKFYAKYTENMPPGENDFERAKAFGSLGKLRQELGQREPAKASYAKGVELLEKTHPPPTDQQRQVLLDYLTRLAVLEYEENGLAEAKPLLDQALGQVDKLPADAESLRLASTLRYHWAGMLRKGKKLPEAEKEFMAALELLERSAKSAKADAATTFELVRLHADLAETQLVRKKATEAVEHLTAALRFLEKPSELERRLYRGQLQASLAKAYELLEQPREADQAFDEALATFQSLAAQAPTNPEVQHLLANAHINLARHLMSQGKNEEALQHLSPAAPILDKLLREFPNNATYRADAIICQQCMQIAINAVRDKK